MQTMRITLLIGAAMCVFSGAVVAGKDDNKPATLAPSGSQDATNPFRIRDCLIGTIKVAVPSEEAGQLMAIKVRDGQEVKAGDLIAQIDDRQSVVGRRAAAAKLLATQTEVENDVKVRHAEASRRVAQYEYLALKDANTRQADTYTKFQLLDAQFKEVEAQLAKENAEHDLKVARVKVTVQEAERDASDLDVERRKVKAPITGVVRQRNREEGEWVKPGDTVVEMLQMDRLRIDALLNAQRVAPREVLQQPVEAKVVLPGGREGVFQGKIIWVDSEVGQDESFQVRAELENRRDEAGHWLLLPGLRAEMTIQPRASRP
jgi:multidrug efflux pump subunit AcrA (membrane-fusion protein)